MYSFAILRLCGWNLNFTDKQVISKNKRLTMFHYQNLIVFAPKLFFYCFHLWRKASEIIMIQMIYLTAQCSPRCKVTQSDATGQTRIYTPSVIWALQRHLVSSEPELGGPLENQVHTFHTLTNCPVNIYTSPLVQDVPPGRASSHWESRTLQGSIMTATLGDPATVRVDAITLAALQDTGWYTVNLTRSQSLVWGQGE